MVVDSGVQTAERPRVMVVAALIGALGTVISVSSSTLATGELVRPGSTVVTMTALALMGFAVLRRATVGWWWAAFTAGLSILVFAPFSHASGATADLSTAESTRELLWLTGAMALVVALSRNADRHDTTRLRVSRLDGTLVAVSAATVLALTTASWARELETTAVRGVIVTVHAVVVLVAMATAVRHLLVTNRDRLLVLAVICFTAAGLVRAVGVADGSSLTGDSVLGVAIAAAALVLAVPFHQPSSRTGRRTDLPNERVALVGLCGLAPPAVALVQGGLGVEINGVVLASGMSVVLLLVAARLHLVIREMRDAAARDALIRQTAARFAAARDVRTVTAAAMQAITSVVGDDLEFAGWVSEDRTSGYVVSHFSCRLGHSDPLRAGMFALLDSRRPLEGLEPIDQREGASAILTVIDKPWQGFVVSCGRDLSSEARELLPAIATQAAMAIEGIEREVELLHKRSEARFEELVRHTNDAVMIVDSAGKIRYQTPSVVRLLGYLPVDLDRAAFVDVVAAEHLEQFDRFFRRQLAGSAEHGDLVDLTLLRADGATVEVEMVGSNLLRYPDVDGLVFTIRDVTRHRELEEQLRHLAFHDALTGLANRTLFVERLDHSLTVNRRTEGPAPAVAFIDLDDFKDVNDRLGHAAGDELLRTVAARIDDCVRVGDTAARFGGDEFAVLFEHSDSSEDLVEACERLLDALHEPVSIGAEVVQVRASIGLATRQDGLGEAGEILRCADLAMYAAKAAGKGCVERFASEMAEAMVAQLTNSSDLERAVAADELRVDYQPMVALDSDEVEAFEALARWDHPTRGPVPPSEFVPLAEEIGCIDQLGERVLHTALIQVAEWNRRARRPVAVHVNIAVQQLDSPAFLDLVRRLVGEAGIDPSLLVLEIAESVLTDDAGGDERLNRLAALREFGVRIAIDDFGTGFMSLSYLQRVPFDVLKIDRSFVSALAEVAPEQSLVRTILDLADRLGVAAVAEGVERPVERDALRQLGCSLGQGYLYGRAVSAAEATRQLDRRVLRPISAIA